MTSVEALTAIGGTVEVLERAAARRDLNPDALLSVGFDGVSVVLAVEERRRAPYRDEILHRLGDLREQFLQFGVPTLVAPHISATTGTQLTEAGWSWLDESGNADIRAPGLRVIRSGLARPRHKTDKRLPGGVWSLAVIRLLIAQGESPGPSVLSRRIGISQPRASQVLGRLVEAGFVSKLSGRHWRLEDREGLLNAFLSEYRGPGGHERWLFTLDSPVVFAERLEDMSQPNTRVLLSGDVAADRLVPWRVPTVVVAYSEGSIDPMAIGAVDALGQSDGNVLLRVPRDTSILRCGGSDGLADPAQIAWDLRDLGGSDRIEASERIKDWLLSH